MKNKIYINIAVVGNVNEVLNNLLNRIKKSNLYENTEEIFLIINGDINGIGIEINDPKYIISNQYKDISNCEAPTLELLWKHSLYSNLNHNILYLHTKGVTKPYKNIQDWTNYLAYFNIDRWKDRIIDLESNDTTGVNFGGNKDDLNEHPSTWGYGKAPLHYSGNFWWTKTTHIRKLPNPFLWCPDSNHFRWRMMDEMWLCQINDAKYHNAHSSKLNHYISEYPKNLYEFD